MEAATVGAVYDRPFSLNQRNKRGHRPRPQSAFAEFKRLARVYRVTAKKARNVRIDQRFAATGRYDLTGVSLEAL